MFKNQSQMVRLAVARQEALLKRLSSVEIFHDVEDMVICLSEEMDQIGVYMFNEDDTVGMCFALNNGLLKGFKKDYEQWERVVRQMGLTMRKRTPN